MTPEQRAFKVVNSWILSHPDAQTKLEGGIKGPLGDLAELICVEIYETQAEECKACKEIAEKEYKLACDLKNSCCIHTTEVIVSEIEMRGKE